MQTTRFKIIIIAVLLLSASPVFAAELRTGKVNEIIPGGETHSNLYVAGGNVRVESQTLGDLTAAGGTITINGNIEHNLEAAGGTIETTNNIGGNAKIAGGKHYSQFGCRL